MTMQAGLTVWAWRPRQVAVGRAEPMVAARAGGTPARAPSTTGPLAHGVRLAPTRVQGKRNWRQRRNHIITKAKKQWHSHGAVAMPLQKYNYTLMKPCPRYAAKEQTLLVFVLVLTLRTIVSVHHSSVKLVFGLNDIKQFAGRYYGHHLVVIRLLNLL